MFYFSVPFLCLLACLVQTALSQRCNQIFYGSGSSPSCGSYGGAGTGQVGVSGDIGASGTTCVVGSVPVVGSVGFGGCSPACGSVSICGQCGCDSLPEEPCLTSTASTPDFFGRSSTVAVTQNRGQPSGFLGQSNFPQGALTQQCNCGSVNLSGPRVSSPRSITQTASGSTGSSPSLNQNTPSVSISAPSTCLSTPGVSLNVPRISPGCRSCGGSNQYSSGSAGSSGLSGCGSYGGAGTGQVGVSGDIGASGTTVVVGSVPVRGSVDFGGCTPTCGSVCISGQCECGCD